MKIFLNKIFNYKKKISIKDELFLEISKLTKVSEVFKAISSFSETSEIRYVGGCVRKILDNEIVDDIDLATNLRPEEVKKCLKLNNIKFYETGIEHGTITANIDNKNFEITSLRKDIATDGRHAIVDFTTDWNEDASRRDFTINSIYADQEGNLFDPYDGVKHLKEGIISFIGDPEKRIQEDYLRILRYVRFFIKYSKQKHQPDIKKIIKQNIKGVKNLSKERLLSELKKIIDSDSLIKLCNDEFCKEIILLIFPQLKNLDNFKKLNKYSINIISKKDFTFLISLLVIDKTDNSDYFLYKFNTSNEMKKRINFLKDKFQDLLDKDFFSKKNLQKIFYFYGKSYLIDIIDFKLFNSNKVNNNLIKLKDYFKEKEKPIFPVKAKTIMERYNIKEGKELGEKLKSLEILWVSNNFNLSEKEIDKVFLN